MDFEKFIGKNASDAKNELEKLGFEVLIKDNLSKELENPVCLVTRARILKNNVVELVTSKFKFVSKD